MSTLSLFGPGLLPEMPYPHGFIKRANGEWLQICSRCACVYSFSCVKPASWIGAYSEAA